MPAGKVSDRKARRKAELSEKLAKTLTRLEVAAKQADEGLEPRHDPKHTAGTFWKERKERKKRTLFIGGLPSNFKADDLNALLDSVSPGQAAAEIDFVGGSLPDRKASQRPRNAFVLFHTSDEAHAAQTALNGFMIHGSRLRVNFSDDKAQRETAINKRSGLHDKRQFASRSRY